MKSVSIRNFAGQANLRGKLSKRLSCGCCEVIDFRWEQRLKEAANEIAFGFRNPREVSNERSIAIGWAEYTAKANA